MLSLKQPQSNMETLLILFGGLVLISLSLLLLRWVMYWYRDYRITRRNERAMAEHVRDMQNRSMIERNIRRRFELGIVRKSNRAN